MSVAFLLCLFNVLSNSWTSYLIVKGTNNLFSLYKRPVVLLKCIWCTIICRPYNCMCAEWEQWTEYGPCTAHCGGGRKSRSRIRECNDINLNLQKSQQFICIKNVTQYQVCNTQECGKLSICTCISLIISCLVLGIGDGSMTVSLRQFDL